MMRPRLAVLNDLVQAIIQGDHSPWTSRRMDRRAARLMLTGTALERLIAACDALMSRIGDAARVAVAEQALAAYRELDADGRHAFFVTLRENFGADPEAIRRAFHAYDADPSAQALVPLFKAVEPARQKLLRNLNLADGATRVLVDMRADLLRAMRDDPALAPLDADFAHLFESWFNRGFLRLAEIDWSTSAEVLEKLIRYESVHPISGWDDLRRRLNQGDRRCYGFFHPATGKEPLIFVSVALMHDIPDEIAPILSAAPGDLPEDADTAVFYSINNALDGLRGVSFGSFLIKQVVAELSAELPSLKTFVTLSPVPGFAKWLDSTDEPDAAELSEALKRGDWRGDEAEAARLKPRVEALAAIYLTEAKTPAGAPLDPVARFHLGNGATAWRVNWPADLSDGALAQAHGLMVNYLYEPDAIEAQHEAFVREGRVAVGAPLTAAKKGRAKARQAS